MSAPEIILTIAEWFLRVLGGIVLAGIVVSLIEAIREHLTRFRCPHCGSRDTHHSYGYIRGYNRLCQQAAGDAGHYCRGCGGIAWDQTHAQFVASCPSWVHPYRGEWHVSGRHGPAIPRHEPDTAPSK